MNKLAIGLCGLSILCAPLQAQETPPAEPAGSPQTEYPPGVLKLEATIRGSREQPKVMSIVPWQPPSQNNLLPSPVMRRIDQTFSPLDREEFLRRLAHFEKLSNQ